MESNSWKKDWKNIGFKDGCESAVIRAYRWKIGMPRRLCVTIKKMEPHSLYNWVRARHMLDTKTNLGVPSTCTKYQTYGRIAPEVHGIPIHSPKPASHRTDLTPIPLEVAQVRFFHHKPKIPLLVTILGGNPACPPTLPQSPQNSPQLHPHKYKKRVTNYEHWLYLFYDLLNCTTVYG